MSDELWIQKFKSNDNIYILWLLGEIFPLFRWLPYDLKYIILSMITKEYIMWYGNLLYYDEYSACMKFYRNNNQMVLFPAGWHDYEVHNFVICLCKDIWIEILFKKSYSFESYKHVPYFRKLPKQYNFKLIPDEYVHEKNLNFKSPIDKDINCIQLVIVPPNCNYKYDIIQNLCFISECLSLAKITFKF